MTTETAMRCTDCGWKFYPEQIYEHRFGRCVSNVPSGEWREPHRCAVCNAIVDYGELCRLCARGDSSMAALFSVSSERWEQLTGVGS